MIAPASYRLPRHVVPEHYLLELHPALNTATFAGSATVTLRVDEPVTEIVLNAAELEISLARLEATGEPPRVATVTIGADEQRATLRFTDPVPPADGYRLRLEFTGVLNDKLRGFYRSTFTDEEGRERVIATTQFEPADARRAFPCWDEPDFKATFEVTLVVEDHLTALSNSSAVADEPAGPGRRRVRFAPTIPMSTYLVAFIVGPFELTAPLDVDGVPLRVAAPPGKAHLSGYALETASFALRFLAGYFELPYPGDKIDHVAVPDFAFGAMENLGCVTYRETALLLDPATAAQLERQRVATVVAHETAHMWFGDLVTMKWWNGIWLNEAFATFMELTTTDALEPEWQVWTAFGANRAAALTVDGLRSTRPVEFAVDRPEEAEAMFDVLTYQKGASVLRMLEQYLSRETFRRGIVEYLTKHRFSNTETTDLWDAIEAVSGEPVRSITDTWIFQSGYPVVTVAPLEGGRGISLQQRRFVYAEGPSSDRDGMARWVIPVNLRASVGGVEVRRRLLLDGPATTVDFGEHLDWVVVNEGACGFYRTAYTPSLLEGLIAAGFQRVCRPLERMSVIGDTWAGVVSGSTPLPEWVALTRALEGEDDPDVWATVLGALGVLDLIVPQAQRPALAAFVRRVVGPVFARLGWDPRPGEAQRLGIARSRLIQALGVIGDDRDVQSGAAARHARFLTDRSALSPDVVTAVVQVLAASGGVNSHRILLEEYRRAATPQDKVRYLMALGATEGQDLLAQTLELSLTSEVRIQDAPFLIGSILGSRAGGQLAWEWIEAHWHELLDRFPNTMVLRMLEGLTAVTNASRAERAHRWLASHEIPVGGPRLAQIEERMDITVALAERIGAEIAGALS